MRTLILAALLSQPQDGTRVGIVWDPQATGDDNLRQRVERTIAELPGTDGAPVSQALFRARWVIGHQVSREAIRDYEFARAELTAATAAFRSGDSNRALDRIEAVRASIMQAPQVPGAARLLWDTEILRALIAEAGRDHLGADRALANALALDPDAVLSTRLVPPELVLRYEQRQRELLVTRATWRPPAVEVVDGDVVFEVDGQPGLRPVPPGDHLLVARRPGRRPVAIVQPSHDTWVVPTSEEVLRHELPVEAEAIAHVCRAVAVDVLVLLRVRGQRVGWQRHDCERGFGPIHVASSGEVETSLRASFSPLGSPRGAAVTKQSRLGDAGAWPADQATSRTTPRAIIAKNVAPDALRPRAPWYRRAWFWGLVGSLVVGGVTTGVVLGTLDAQPRVQIDTPSFTEGER